MHGPDDGTHGLLAIGVFRPTNHLQSPESQRQRHDTGGTHANGHQRIVTVGSVRALIERDNPSGEGEETDKGQRHQKSNKSGQYITKKHSHETVLDHHVLFAHKPAISADFSMIRPTASRRAQDTGH